MPGAKAGSGGLGDGEMEIRGHDTYPPRIAATGMLPFISFQSSL